MSHTVFEQQKSLIFNMKSKGYFMNFLGTLLTRLLLQHDSFNFRIRKSEVVFRYGNEPLSRNGISYVLYHSYCQFTVQLKQKGH